MFCCCPIYRESGRTRTAWYTTTTLLHEGVWRTVQFTACRCGWCVDVHGNHVGGFVRYREETGGYTVQTPVASVHPSNGARKKDVNDGVVVRDPCGLCDGLPSCPEESPRRDVRAAFHPPSLLVLLLHFGRSLTPRQTREDGDSPPRSHVDRTAGCQQRDRERVRNGKSGILTMQIH